MNSMFSIGLATCLLISTSPLVAAESMEMPASAQMRESTTPGPIVKAMVSEAVRLAAERPVRERHPPASARTWRRTGMGALIGLGAGAALGMTVGQEACLNEPRWHCAKVGIPFAAIGALVAWLHE